MVNTIKMNLREGDSIKINAIKSFMQSVEQNVSGGNLEHRATEELIQLNNTMEASAGGQILNEVDGGKLTQENNVMRATKKGMIANKVKEKNKTVVPTLVTILLVLLGGVGATWYFFPINIESVNFHF